MHKTVFQGFMTLSLLAGAFGIARTAPADEGFTLRDTAGKYLDVLLDGRIAARYMYEYDKSSPARLAETYKPYLHVFNAEGTQPITKGPGGLYTHHRGIFIGWNSIKFENKTYDRWHMKGGEIVHQKFLSQKASAKEATFTSLTHWNDAAGKPMIVEERTMTLRRGDGPFRLVIDFHAKLSAPRGDISLGGDPEHAGIHYRPANEVHGKQTTYYFPKEDANCHKDLDYPWVGETYVLGGKKYSAVEINPPTNPKGTRWSAYRDYGRFGAFPVAKIKKGGSLSFDYRFLIADGEMPAAETIQKSWDEFSKTPSASPVPKVSVVLAEQPNSQPKPKADPKASKAKTKGKK